MPSLLISIVIDHRRLCLVNPLLNAKEKEKKDIPSSLPRRSRSRLGEKRYRCVQSLNDRAVEELLRIEAVEIKDPAVQSTPSYTL